MFTKSFFDVSFLIKHTRFYEKRQFGEVIILVKTVFITEKYKQRKHIKTTN